MRILATVLIAIAALLILVFALGGVGEVLGTAVTSPGLQTVVFVAFDAILVALAVWLWRRTATKRESREGPR